MSMCAIDDCETPASKRGFCNRHYLRWRRHGDPLAGGTEPITDPEAAFSARTRADGDCLVWTARLTAQGYGRITIEGRDELAHRYAWSRVHGRIPDGVEIDHTCWNRACVSIAHLRAATKAENMRNRRGPQASNIRTRVRNVEPTKNGYCVRIKKDGRRYYFGTYPTLEEADAVASERRKELFGEFAGIGRLVFTDQSIDF